MNLRHLLFICVFFLAVGCNNNHCKELDLAYTLAKSSPDSALKVLDKINSSELNGDGEAKYSLIYTMAQDKSGLDVDNDSLIRTAYNYYKTRQGDSLYAQCMYYMGKYYMLNDSSENAIATLEESRKVAHSNHNMEYECLAFDRLSKLIRLNDPAKALSYSRMALNTYDKMPKNSKNNMVYYMLSEGECYAYLDSMSKAIDVCKYAITLAKTTKDSLTISDAYQDLSFFYSKIQINDSAIYYSKLSYDIGGEKSIYKKMNLASAYLNADSTERTLALLEDVKAAKNSDKYSLYYLLAKATLKIGHEEQSREYYDSAFHYIEEMYKNAYNNTNSYYLSLLAKEQESYNSKRRTLYLRTSLLIILVFGACLIFITLFIF